MRMKKEVDLFLAKYANEVLENSVERPVFDIFPALAPLTEPGGRVGVNISQTDFEVQRFNYIFHGRFDAYEVPHIMLGIRKNGDPVGYFDITLSPDPEYSQHCSDADATVDIHNANNFCTFRNIGLPTFATYVADKWRGKNIGHTTHAIMMALLQKEGYPNYTVFADATSEYKYCARSKTGGLVDVKSGGQLLRSRGRLNLDPSFYGRYGTKINGIISQDTYSTHLSTYQVDLLRRAVGR
ncbi:MAG: hypothetical protein U0525_05880 [Patescibacteria group bacterium]